MKKIIFVLVIISFVPFVNAQVPGYMGKRLTIGYANYFNLALLGPTRENFDVGFNSTHCINLEYSIKNRTNLCFSFQAMNTGVEDHQHFYYNFKDQYGNEHNVAYAYNLNVPMQLYSHNIGVGLKFFKGGTFAPVGKYNKLEFLLFFTHLTYNNKAFVASENTNQTFGYNPPKQAVGTGDYSYKTFALIYNFGRQRILFNRIVLDYGTRIGIVPGGFIPILDDTTVSLVNDMSPENLFKYDTYARLFRYQLINVHIGIGFLAF